MLILLLEISRHYYHPPLFFDALRNRLPTNLAKKGHAAIQVGEVTQGHREED